MREYQSMLNRWSKLHLYGPQAYADTITYQLGADWLRDCELVEDWGCGLGWLRTFIEPERYRGIDGTKVPGVDVVTDLRMYRSQVPGVFMRHVLEHNVEWATILDNALVSFTRRMVLILFTPMGTTTRSIAWNPDADVPDIAFNPYDLECRFPSNVTVRIEDLDTLSQYGTERVYYLERVRG